MRPSPVVDRVPPHPKESFRIRSRAWLAAPLLALMLIVWSDVQRARHVMRVSQAAAEGAAVDSTSPTGYSGGKRWLIVPEHNNRSYQWIEETEQMLTRGDWRVRAIDYENAPAGREVHSASPYRWWLGLAALVDHVVTGRPLSWSVEHSVLWADPALHILLLLITVFLLARWFGPAAAVIASVVMAGTYPLSATFLPGVPDQFGLQIFVAGGSVLPLLAALIRGPAPNLKAKRTDAPAGPASTDSRQRRLFGLAGVMGAIGLWLGASDQIPVFEGIILGAFATALLSRRVADPGPALPWRFWALAGAVTSLAAYLIEYFPAHLDWRVRVNHPIYGVAWLGLGELLAWFDAWNRHRQPLLRGGVIVRLLLAALAVAALPLALVRGGAQGFLAADLQDSRLANLADSPVAESLRVWMQRDGMTASVFATLVPMVAFVAALWLVFRTTDPRRREILGLALGPAAVAAVLAGVHLRSWGLLDALLLGVWMALLAGSRRPWLWAAVAGVVALCGLRPLLPATTRPDAPPVFTRAEAEELYERSIAHWLADHADTPRPVVLVPPFRTASFTFYGNQRGLGTPNWENRDGLSATFRIVNATRPDETQALVAEHEIAYIVIPSWDTDLNDIARVGLKRPEDSFIYALTHWVLFDWLRPWPYRLPELPGFEGQSVQILSITDDADPATHRGRLVEYFIEMQRLDIAAYASKVLRRYPTDVGALAALVQVDKAVDDEAAFANDFASLTTTLAGESRRGLAWDRRVSLAVALALGKRHDLAREQVARCLTSLDEAHLRQLTSGTLYHFLVLCRAYGLEAGDSHLREYAATLLPDELRSRL
ncbi:MAG TPA: hypothetical protein VHD32_16485 [Candidatus Didemnitutus sp.]|nr:hypothetical protein [Candidatus Didemnitutus sp.]